MGGGKNGDRSPDTDRKKRHKKHRHRGSRSRSRSRSPKKRRRRSDSRERRRSHKKRSHSRSPRRRSRSPRKHRSRSRSPRRRSRSPRRRSRSPPPIRPPMGGGHRRRGPPLSPPRGDVMGFGRRRSPDPEPPSEDRDRRTVMCMQLSQRVGPKELEEFFQQVGQVREVKMIADKNSRRSKGIAYVEFHDEKSMTPAISMSGQKLFGVPIIVQPTMAEKNRLAALAQNLKKAEGPKKLYVGSLHYNITDSMLKAIFEPFGHVEKLAIQKDETGHSKGFGFVEFRDSESCERAMTHLNGFELAGRPMKISNVTERDLGGAGGGAMDMLDGEDSDVGVGMTPHSRAALMAKLAEGHNAGLSVPQVPQVPPPSVVPSNSAPAISTCFMLSNMFDVSAENEAGWEQDIRDDVLEECSRFGAVLHVYVDSFSQGNVYVKCTTSQVAAAAFNNLNGRFFAGKKIVAQFIPETTYHIKFPVAASSTAPLQPSS